MKIMFRKFKITGDVVALMPEFLDADGFVTTYMHVGQHGAGDYDYLLKITVPAKPEEYEELYRELKQIGYPDIQVMKRRPRKINYEAEYKKQKA